MRAGNALFFCADRAMFPAAVFAAHSAGTNARANHFDTYIGVLENSIEPTWIDWVETHVGATVKEVPFSEHIGIAKTANKAFPPSICYRYLFHLFLPDRYRKVIYADADMRMVGDISRLFDLDLGSQAFGACPDVLMAADPKRPAGWAMRHLAGIKWDISIPYANSGLLVIKPDAWLARSLGEQVLKLSREKADVFGLLDQDALNLIVRGDYAPISPVWNMLTRIWCCTDLADIVSPVVLHYASHKPWRPFEWRGSLTETTIYRNFFKNSPWPRFVSLTNDLTWKNAKFYARKWSLERLTGRTKMKPPVGVSLDIYREHICTFPFADKRQGIVVPDAAGVMR